MSKKIENNRIIVIIPAYNEEATIVNVTNQIRQYASWADIVVVNDASTDRTRENAQAAGAKVLDLPVNLGIGGAMQTGFKYAAAHGYDIAVQVDGDGQHDPRSLSELIEPIVSGQADMVIGSRHIENRGYDTPLARRTGMRIFSGMLSLILHQKVTDTTSGFRGINRRTIDFFAKNYPTDYPEVEALVICHYAGLRLAEVPVDMNLRQAGRSSITPLHAPYYMFKVGLAVLIWLIRKKPRIEGGD